MQFVFTDNGANFVKAFVEFGVSHDSDSVTDTDEEASVGTDEENTIDFNQIIADNLLLLPSHLRCASHTLNLVASRDLSRSILSRECKQIMRSSLAKCSALWNRAHRSVQAAEIIQSNAHRALIFPTETRWNSLYDAFQCLLNVESSALDSICDALELIRLSQSDGKFLLEYCQVLRPLANALDILQEEKTACLGIYIYIYIILIFLISFLNFISIAYKL